MGLLTKTVEVKWNGCTKKHYEKKGYVFSKLFEKFDVSTIDLPLKSNIQVEVKCDYCGEQKETRYSNYIKNYYLKKEGKYACVSCSNRMKFVLSYKEVKNTIESNGYKLLSKTYNHAHDKIEVECPNGHKYEVEYANFKYGKNRCPECTKERWIGDKNPNYNPNLTDEERENNISRNSDKLNRSWSKTILKKDNYTCQCCGIIGYTLNAHHLDGYGWAIEKRHDKNNGVALCEDCHKEFHNKYGYGDNTKEQFEEFIKNKDSKSAIA